MEGNIDTDNLDIILDVDIDNDGTTDDTQTPTLIKDKTIMEDGIIPEVDVNLDNSINNKGTLTITGSDDESGIHSITYSF